MMDMAPIPEAEYERRQGKAARFSRVSTDIIMATSFPPIRWVVPGYVAEGLAILAGRQKLGKTWLAIDWAVAVATGGCAMGLITCEAGNVLYIDMENGPRRIQSRIKVIFPDERMRPDLSRLEWTNEAPALDKGFIEALDDWRMSVPKPRLVIIDVLQRVKPAPSSANRNAYENDYAALADLQHWTTTNGIAVVVLHHTRKGGADDPLEALSGSNGLSACADTTIVLDRNQNGTTLSVRGRDVEEKESALKFTGGLWTAIGAAAEVRQSEERRAVLAVLRASPEPMSPSDIAAAAGKSLGSVRKLVLAMAGAGEIERLERGRYVANPGNIGNYGNFDG